jgi:hypothetical protein
MLLTQDKADKLTEELVKKIKNKQNSRKYIIFEYACLLDYNRHWLFDWTHINNTIIDRWSRSGLERIKQAAWKELQ